MSFEDSLYLAVLGLGLIMAVLVSAFVWNTIFPTIESTMPSELATQLDDGMNKNWQFFNYSFAALMVIFAIISAVLTLFIFSHPVVLVVWLLFNVVVLYVYDSLDTFLTAFETTDYNVGVMDDAIAFYRAGMPKLIPVMNMLMAIIMLGKRLT